MDTEKVLKWAVIAVFGYLIFRWFAGVLTNIVGSADTAIPNGYQYGVPYNPAGIIAPSPWSVTAWYPTYGYPVRNRNPRYTYGGR